MPATVNINYDYTFSSTLLKESGSARNLRLATSGGAEKNPYFFTGRLIAPKQTADLLLTLSAISRTRFFSPGELRARMIAAADPVVTSDGSMLRFEVFSVCCGAYARLDLNGNAIDGDWLGKGTTNVDFNSGMRVALASVISSEDVGIKVGSDRVEIERDGKSVVERKVKLPVRWLKGFVEVQAYQSKLSSSLEIPALELAKILRTLPQQNIMQAGTITYLVPAGKNLRLSQRTASGAIGVGAISRLKILEPILRYAKSVRIYNSAESISAFELILSNGSFFLVLSPNAARGFSGEGQALQGLADSCPAQVVARVRSSLSWRENFDAQSLSSSLQIDVESIRSALQILGSRGLVGYDLSSASYFHRELPFDLSLVEELHPRMKKAREILKENRLQIKSRTEELVEAYLSGDTSKHFIQLTSNGGRCTCEWFAKNQGERGPCSHILALELKLHEEDA